MSLSPEERRELYLDTGWEELLDCEVCGNPVDDGDEPGAVQVDGRMVDVCSIECTRAAIDGDSL